MVRPTNDDKAGSVGSPTKKDKKIRGRGRTVLAKVTRHRDKNLKFEVKWDMDGKAIGTTRPNYKSYLGICTRSRVNINYRRWDHVPEHIKDAIFTQVSGVFEVPESGRRMLLHEASCMFRSFKSKLGGRFMFLNKEQRKIRPHPPEKYTFITQQMWDDFITYRLSPEFEEDSDKHRLIAEQNINEYKYRGSRKGYPGIEEEMILEMEPTTRPSTRLPRDQVWLKAREDKDGNMDECVQEIANKMAEVSQKASQGEIKLSGRQDLLATVLGKKEHPGRVMGVGGGVTITQYFGRKNTKVQDNEVIDNMRAEIEALKRKCAALEIERKDRKNDQEQVEIQSEMETCPNIDFPEGWSKCKLASPEPGHSIVATGNVFNTLDLQNMVIHNIPLKPGHMKVSITDPLVPDAPLPVPTIEACVVFEAKGSFVQWPKNLIFLEKVLNGDKKKEKSVNLDALSEFSNTANTGHQRIEKLDDSNPTKDDLLKLSTPTLQMMYKIARTIGTISIPIHKDSMTDSEFMYITKEEIFQWIFQREIQATHISVYIGYLLDTCDKNSLSKFGFMCPFRIAEIPLVVPTEQQAAILVEKRQDQARYIAEAMKNAKRNQIFLAPYNSKRHWMLCAIHPHKQTVFWLDPIGGNPRIGIKNIVDISLKIWTAQNNSNKPSRSTKWIEIKCPRQTNNIDCGYYVLQYIQEIINRGLDFIPEKYYPDSCGLMAYGTDQMDVLRDQWATYVQRFID